MSLLGIIVHTKITESTFRCDICKTTVLDHNYYLHVVDHLDGQKYNIHDNDICIEKLKVNLGLAQPNFWSTRPVEI